MSRESQGNLRVWLDDDDDDDDDLKSLYILIYWEFMVLIKTKQFSINLTIRVCFDLFIYFCIYAIVFLSILVCFYQSIYLSILAYSYLSIYLSILVCFYLSIYLS